MTTRHIFFCFLVGFFLTTWSVHAREESNHQSPEFYFAADEQGVQVGVAQPFSTWSDLTALFRPSRWKSPFVVGGSLSWLNYNAWREDTDRTGKVLIGELILAGTIYAILEKGDSSGGDPLPSAPSTAPDAKPGNGGSGNAADPGAESPF